MKIKSATYTKGFKKYTKELPQNERKLLEQKLNIFLEDPFQPQLKTHKLTGKLKMYWAFSVNFKVRVIFEFVSDTSVGFIAVGTHEIYR